jgi:hypothetical protein
MRIIKEVRHLTLANRITRNNLKITKPTRIELEFGVSPGEVIPLRLKIRPGVEEPACKHIEMDDIAVRDFPNFVVDRDLILRSNPSRAVLLNCVATRAARLTLGYTDGRLMVLLRIGHFYQSSRELNALDFEPYIYGKK